MLSLSQYDAVLPQAGGLRDITVDVRIIAATNKNLSEAVKAGSRRNQFHPSRCSPDRHSDAGCWFKR
jgi:transcriptional regulator of acetoin/glycerol metabolism